MTQTLQRRAPAIAMVVALLLVAMMVTRTSQAAFTASTDNTGNSFSAGTVELTDDDLGSAMFAVADLGPGDTQTACIEVTYTGSVAGTQGVVLYSAATTTDTAGVGGGANLSSYLNVTVVEGDAGSTCSAAVAGTPITGPASATPSVVTLADLDARGPGYATGLGGWVPTAGETRAYAVTVELDADTPNSEQGASTSNVGFVWEVQS